jgi:cobalt-zinc-cadmium efflux system outer membrane protein
VQQRIALEALERARVAALNRLRVHPLDEPIETPRPLADVGAPRLATAAEAAADAEARSPELAQARLAVAAAERRTAVAQRDRFPDLTVSAGVMPRGRLEPMWTASVAIGLPIFSGRKQARAVAEASSRREAEARGEDAVRQLVALRARERHTVLEAVLATLALYRETLLVQSDAAVRSTLAQYKVGKVPFASVLEVMRGYVADEGGFLDALAQAQRLAIADREVSLDAPGELGGGGSGGSVPGSAGLAGGGARRGGAGKPEAPAAGGGGAGGGAMPSGM